MGLQKRKTRMYEPWGYREQEAYQSDVNEANIKLDEFFADVNYNRDDNKIHFENKDGKEVAALDVNEFVKSDSIIEYAKYEDGKIIIKFTNGDVVTIDVEELIDENEFKDGLQVNEGQVSVLVDSDTEKSYVTQSPYLTVSENGVKVEGINLAVETEKERAEAEEQRLDEKIDQEIADRIADVDAEEARAVSAETVLNDKIETEKTRATQTEQAINSRVNALNDELDAEESVREASDERLRLALEQEVSRATTAESSLGGKIDQEIADRIADVDAEEARAISAETALDGKIDEINEKLEPLTNDTLVTTNENEIAFGQYNISNTGEEPSGQTIFSIGNGTSDAERSNALEVRKDGSVYLLIEGEMLNINQLLGQIAHEIY